MGLPKLKKFLVCMSLETGGLVIGWFTAFSCFILLGYLGAVLGGLAVFNEMEKKYGVLLIIILSIFVFVASLLLIRSTRLRSHSNMMPFMIFMVIGFVLPFLHVLKASWKGLAIAIVTASVEAYFFLCICSLYSLFKDEYMGKNQPIPMLPMPLDSQPYNHQPTAFLQYHGEPSILIKVLNIFLS